MEEKIISERFIKGDLDFSGKLIFAKDLGLVKVEGYIKNEKRMYW